MAGSRTAGKRSKLTAPLGLLVALIVKPRFPEPRWLAAGGRPVSPQSSPLRPRCRLCVSSKDEAKADRPSSCQRLACALFPPRPRPPQAPRAALARSRLSSGRRFTDGARTVRFGISSPAPRHAPLHCDGATSSLKRLSVGAVKNGTATLSYCDELARIPIYAQAPISHRGEILLQNRIRTRHFRHESTTPAARFLFLRLLPRFSPARRASPPFRTVAWQHIASRLTLRHGFLQRQHRRRQPPRHGRPRRRQCGLRLLLRQG